MKVLVFSDAHRKEELIHQIMEWNPDIDVRISLGDSEVQHSVLLEYDILAIKGNALFDPGQGYEAEISLLGYKTLLTHGHKFGIHKGITKLANYALENDFSVVLYGHTHIARIDRANKTMFLNPGSISQTRGELEPSYCILDISKEKIICNFHSSYSNKILLQKEVVL